MSKEQTTKGITPNNARILTRGVENLIHSPYSDQTLEAPSRMKLLRTRKQAKAVYWKQVDKFVERSPGYDERLVGYRKLGMLLASAPHVHLFFRILDDYIDGDFDSSQEEIIQLVEGVAESIKGVRPKDKQPEIMPLYESGFQNWGRSTEEIQEVRDLSLYAILHMLEDPIRKESGKPLEQDEFDIALLHNTGATTALLQAALRIPQRSFSPDESRIEPDFKRSTQLQAFMQHNRQDDLRKDLKNELPNLPAEVLRDSGLVLPISLEQLRENPAVRNYMERMTMEGYQVFERVRERSKTEFGLRSFPHQNLRARIVVPRMMDDFQELRQEAEKTYGLTPASLRI